MKIGIISFTSHGCALGRRVASGLKARGDEAEEFTKSKYTLDQDVCVWRESLSQWTEMAFQNYQGILFLGACGIAVRSIAPYVQDKKTDPAVLVMDERGIHVISLLSGHLGRANELTQAVADLTGAHPVITTATDINDKFAVDVFAGRNQLAISNMKAAKEVSAELVQGESVGFYCETPVSGTMPGELYSWDPRDHKDSWKILVTPFTGRYGGERTLYLVPKVFTLGIGCRKGVSMEDIYKTVSIVVERTGMDWSSIQQISTIDIKKEEPGLVAFAGKLGVDLLTFTAEELNQVPGDFTESQFVKEQVGVGSVCERSAVLASGHGRIIQKKYADNKVTVAVCMREWRVCFE